MNVNACECILSIRICIMIFWYNIYISSAPGMQSTGWLAGCLVGFLVGEGRWLSLLDCVCLSICGGMLGSVSWCGCVLSGTG